MESNSKNAPKTRKAEAAAADKAAEAEELRLRGNEAFKEGDYVGSHELYSAAIQLVNKDTERAVCSSCLIHYFRAYISLHWDRRLKTLPPLSIQPGQGLMGFFVQT
jgi:hypothetical protein